MKLDCEWCTLWSSTQILQRHSLIYKISCCFMVHTRMKFVYAHKESMVFPPMILVTHKCHYVYVLHRNAYSFNSCYCFVCMSCFLLLLVNI